jgi:hypothetical protein
VADHAASALDREHVQRVLRATLYEGYALYPYRADALKNRRRFMFGTLHAAVPGSVEPSTATTECLVRGDATTRLEIRVRGLQPIERLADDGAWEEVIEREIALPPRPLNALVHEPEAARIEWPGGEEMDGRVVRRAQRVHIEVTRRAAPLGDGLFRVSVSIHNVTALPAHGRPEDARLAVLSSVHTLLAVDGGRFVSLLDPPADAREAAAACMNIGTWPVLVGEPGADDAMLSAPIILYDHPAVAPESAGDLFDLTEIDELLTLRIRTLTYAEREAARGADVRVRDALDRAATLDAESLARLHGRYRVRATGQQDLPDACDGARTHALRAGQRVRLRPRRRADVLDVALTDRTATIDRIERDVEGRVFVVVTVDDDPGRDLGARGALAHCFFFAPDEVEPLP